MAIEIEDLVGLNRTTVQDLPILDEAGMARRLLQTASTARPLSLAGMRHSQGGHTMAAQGRVLLTAALNQTITVAADQPSVTVDAGATWSALHRVLAPLGLCTAVHQSSPHFTVGGSISVNCHGRDPRYGPVSTTVRSLQVLCGDGKPPTTASPTENADLFRAVIGGYGSCGLILQATLDVVPNVALRQEGRRIGLTGLANDLCELAQGRGPLRDAHLCYGWLCCVTGNTAGMAYAFYDSALEVRYLPDPATAVVQAPLQDDVWGESEMLRAGWSAARSDVPMRVRAWQELGTEVGSAPDWTGTKVKSRMNWMRASVDFAGQRDGSRCDVLLEYFLPASDGPTLERQIRHLGGLFEGKVNILSTTLRLVRADTARPYLAYCAAAPMVCMAIDVEIDTIVGAGGREPDAAARAWVDQATDYVLQQGGTYYLPYFGFADAARFRRAYLTGWPQQAAAIQKYNPDRKFWNAFLARYF